jgi:hypothetical protein
MVFIAKSVSKNDLTFLFIRTSRFEMVEDIDLFLSVLFIKLISILHREVFISKMISICIHIFIIGELSHNPLSWPHEKRRRKVLRFQDKALIMFLILHHEALILSEPGHTSPRFCNSIW